MDCTYLYPDLQNSPPSTGDPPPVPCLSQKKNGQLAAHRERDGIRKALFLGIVVQPPFTGPEARWAKIYAWTQVLLC
jgi:hypothetical protein